jgi:CheY-like chemotaxis protein
LNDASQASAPVHAHGPSSPAHAVLIVEDEAIVAMDLQQTLAGMGYDAFAIAASADEALRHAAERCPDLVLMDIRIKGQRDGIETAALLRGRFGVPVVYLTAHADDATIQRAKRTDPYGYLMKPIRLAELKSAVEVSLYKHRLDKALVERERGLADRLAALGAAVTGPLATVAASVTHALEALRRRRPLDPADLDEAIQFLSELEAAAAQSAAAIAGLLVS